MVKSSQTTATALVSAAVMSPQELPASVQSQSPAETSTHLQSEVQAAALAEAGAGQRFE
jgi:hypothetical protein